MSDLLETMTLLIEPDTLQNALDLTTDDDIIIVDLGSQERFLQAHIPNAQLVTPSETQAGPPIPGFAPSDAQLTELMQRIGLQANSHVVVYDDEGGGWAGRFIWLLDEIGHTKYSYLNGGIHAWIAAGLTVEQMAKPNKLSNIIVQNMHSHSVSVEQVIASLDNNSLQVWDARSPKEYTGEKVNAAKGGHIPGAINYEWTNAMDQTRNLRLKPFDQLLQEITAAGISPEKDTITHCQSHHRSGLTYLIAKLLDFKSIKAYPGSWAEWGNHEATPTESLTQA